MTFIFNNYTFIQIFFILLNLTTEIRSFWFTDNSLFTSQSELEQRATKQLEINKQEQKTINADNNNFKQQLQVVVDPSVFELNSNNNNINTLGKEINQWQALHLDNNQQTNQKQVSHLLCVLLCNRESKY